MNKRQIGSVYELKASDYLTKKGYQIIERNYRCRIGEIDIIAIERDCLCFIEVKYRKNEKTGDPLEAVDKRKQQKIIRTAQYYLLTHSKYQSVKCRFDAVGILGEEIGCWVCQGCISLLIDQYV